MLVLPSVVRRKMRVRFAAGALLAGAIATPVQADELSDVITAYEAFTETRPMEAGRSDQPSGRLTWPQEAPSDMADRRAGLEDIRARLAALPQERLAEEDAINAAYLMEILDWRISGLEFDEQRFAFVAHDGFYNVPYYTARGARLRNEADGRAWIERLRAIPGYFDQQRANMERGIETGWTQPEAVVDVAVAVLTAQTGRSVEEDGLLDPLRALPEDARDALLADGEAALREAVRPAQRAMLDFIDTEYRAAARPDIAISAVPDGRAYYDFLLSYYTTTELTAEEIHALGLSEVERIREQMDAIIAEAGFEGEFGEWLHFLRTDPRFYADSRQDLLDRAAVIAKRIDAVLPAWFSVLPRQPFAVEAVPRDVEENYTTARYGGGDFSQGQPGRFLVNTSHLDQRPLYELPALTLHEAAPGHHTHTALSRENPDLPSFRQARDMLVYREGWALYAERLGHEMGVYQDAYERFGSLSAEMWRACRMVVDTGVHVLGWSYEQARACFTENTALADINIDTELVRYIGAPAGAVAYKVGELKIIELRERAAQALGEDFDIRAFHDLVLAQGQIPMTLLESVVEAWIASEEVGE